jgi:uncharacterized MAPEG superfamily protein
MQLHAASCYAFLLLGLTLKLAFLIGLQGVRRMRSHTFRWPEDAAHWQGAVAAEDSLVERAQAALRNDGESQPLFLAASALWLWTGADLRFALPLFGVYLLARALHGAWLLWPRQPQRNRAFGVSVLCLLLVLADSVRLLVR